MAARPRLLDLFSGAGGAAMGYWQAGFDVVGVDIRPQKRYPFEFHQADAMEYPLEDFDAIHASPPCQAYSRLAKLPWLKDRDYPTLLAPTWERLSTCGVPWVIENVEDAPMPHSTVLCGWTLGLPMYRHRRFGSSHLILAPPHRRHTHVIQAGRRNLATRYRQGGKGDVTGLFGRTETVERSFGTLVFDSETTTARQAIEAAMGIDWMTRVEMTQAIPPAYTKFIGERLIEVV